MSSCPEVDTLVTLATVSDTPETTLRHVLDCDECRSSIAIVAQIRSDYAGGRVRAGFVDEVMAALPVDAGPAAGAGPHPVAGRIRPSAPAPSGRRRYLWWLAEGSLAAGTALFVAAAAGLASPGAVGPTLLPLAGLVGLAVAGRSLVVPLLLLRPSD